VAANFIRKRYPWMRIKTFHNMIQSYEKKALRGERDREVVKAELGFTTNENLGIKDKDLTEEQEKAMKDAGAYYFILEHEFEEDADGNLEDEFLKTFNIVLNGLDNVEARRWVNKKVCDMVPKHPKTGLAKPDYIGYQCIVDGGTEGLLGQSRLIIPFKTACYECSLSTMTKETTVPMCTIAAIPRQPSHCILYAMKVDWENKEDARVKNEKGYKYRGMDKDSAEDQQWVYQKALERAEKFGIDGVTYKMTMGVTKNIIPAIASTNAAVSAMCVNECLKFMNGCNKSVDTFTFYNGSGMTTADAQIHHMFPDCTVCGIYVLNQEVKATETLREWSVRFYASKIVIKDAFYKKSMKDSNKML